MIDRQKMGMDLRDEDDVSEVGERRRKTARRTRDSIMQCRTGANESRISERQEGES